MSSDFIRARLSQDFEDALRAVMTRRVFSRGTVIYEHGVPAAGIYLLETGAVRVSLPLSGRQSQLLEVVGAGAILGLSESLSGDQYRVNAVAEDTTAACFIARKDFAELLDAHHDFCMQVVRLLSDSLHGLYHRFRSVSAHPGRPRRRMLDEELN
ncbi:MAG TPA: Crp/Fnr family transcriptional regulator [Terriglobales bacterium]|nr:Crp/Fnr family transcriptional regulator [Terriglobales bacterium]